jgi:hypothetical protein
MCFLAALFCSLMARVKKTTKPVDSLEVANSASDAVVSFEFGLLRVTLSDLDEVWSRSCEAV